MNIIINNGTLKNIPTNRPVKFKGTLNGNTRSLDVKDAQIDIPGQLTGKVNGTVKNVTDPKKIQAKVKVDADVKDTKIVKPFLDKDIQKVLDVPSVKMKGQGTLRRH